MTVADAFVATLLAEHPDALLRTCRPGHLTGSAFVVDASAERTLLLHHAKLRRWLQPGGHADGEPDLAEVALREAREETGIAGLRVVRPAIDIDTHRVDPPNEDPHLHHDVRFLVLAPEGAVVIGNHESTELRWVREEDIPTLNDEPGLARLARAGFAEARTLLG